MSLTRARKSRRILGTGIATLAALCAIAGTVSPAAAAEGPVIGLGQPDTVPGSFIVQLTDGANTNALAAKYGGTVKHRYTKALNGYAATMTDAQAKRLAADPAVAKVAADQIVRASGAGAQLGSADWGLSRIDQQHLLPVNVDYRYPNTADNVTAYIIDTGIQFGHTDFGGRAVSGYDFADNDTDASDCNGHGTHVAGTVGGTQNGVAKNVKLVAVRVFGCSGGAACASVIAGVDWVTANAVKPAVANMSLGGGVNPLLDAAVQRSIASGVTYSVAGGNDNGDACAKSPARVPEAITVGATDDRDRRAWFSNYGSCLDLFAPGVNIVSAWIGAGNSATNRISGTSMATPHVTGVAALILQDNPAYTPAQVAAAVQTASTKNVDTVSNAGVGSPNALVAVPGTVKARGVTWSQDLALPDGTGEVKKSVFIGGYASGAKASAFSQVGWHLLHPEGGDIRVSVTAPSGRVYPFTGSVGGVDVVTSWVLDLSGEDINGQWTVTVKDVVAGNSGLISTLYFNPLW